MGDCQNAVYWADRVLSLKPDQNSKDPWERGMAEAMTPEGEKWAAQGLGAPQMIGSWKEIQKQMKTIKDSCRK